MGAVHSDSKIALLHYWLTGMRGGEMVLREFCRMFPEADVFTHAAIPGKIDPDIASHQIFESFIARLPLGRRQCQKYLPLMPLALRQWDFSRYNLLISSESGPVKGIRKPESCRHICYCHTPMRYLWDLYDEYYLNAGVCGKLAMSCCKKYLRDYDLRSAENVDLFIANSKFVAERIRRIYNRESTVIYPPVEVDFFQQVPQLERKHYLFVGQLVCYKHPEAAIKIFSKLQNEKLIVVGDGPLRRQLEKTASSNVEFQHGISREKLRELYASAKALLFPGTEDFGIVPVEAQAARCPVIALRSGGALETVIEGKTGTFFDSPAQIPEKMEMIESMTFVEKDFSDNSIRFSRTQFRECFKKILSQN